MKEDRSPLHRLVSTGRVAASAARLAARRVLGAEEGETDAELGRAVAGELDRMKGMAMKVGQILSYFDGVLPAEAHRALRSLQLGAAAMPTERVRGVVEEDLGRPLEELFDRFDPEPVAAASVGQVHRAAVAGREVAVKVQYPGIVEDVDTDLARLRHFGGVVSLGTAVDGRAVVDELAERVRIECDYRAEALAQEAFHRAFTDDPEVDVPRVVTPRSGTRVLTTLWRDGRSFYEVAEEAGEAERRRVARVLLRFAHRSFFQLGAVNADPHPGNYLFPAPAPAGGGGPPGGGGIAGGPRPPGAGGDGGFADAPAREGAPVVFLDFGCVRRFDRDFVEGERRVARAVLSGNRAAFRDAVVSTGIVPADAPFDWDLHRELMRHQYAPYLRPRFRFERGFVLRGMELCGPSNPNLRRMAFPPQWIWLVRLQWGLNAVLARLGAEGAFREVLERWLDAEPVAFDPWEG